MSSVINELPNIRYCTYILPTKSLPKNSILNNEDEHIFDQLTDRLESPPYVIYGNGRSLFQFRNKHFFGICRDYNKRIVLVYF